MKQQLPNGDTVEKAEGYRAETAEWDLPAILPVPLAGPDGKAQLVRCAASDVRALNACFPPDRPPFAVFALIGHSPNGSLGMYAPFNAAQLRDYAATMLEIADSLDQGRGKQ